MIVKRIVCNIETPDPAAGRAFYVEALGLTEAMNLGWIATYAGEGDARPQISFAVEGGSGTPVPDLSIEVDDVDEALRRIRLGGFAIEYGPVDEPWGARRFYARDPFGRLVNILQHV